MRVFYQPVLSIVFLLIIYCSPASAQTYTVLHDFTGGSDGGSPQAGVTLGGAGTLYGTTTGGGIGEDPGYGVAFQITHETGGWILAPMYSFGGLNGVGPEAPVVFGPGGLLYGSTTNGGNLLTETCFNRGCGVIFTLQPPPTECHAVLCNWIETPIYQFASLTDGFEPTGPLAFDQAGNIYGTTALGGTGGCINGCGTVFELTRSGDTWTKTTLTDFGDGITPVSGVIVDRSGVLYGTATAGGLFNHGTVFQLTPSGSGWTFSVIYNFHDGLNGDNDGGEPQGGLVMDAAGDLYGTTGTGGTGGGGTVFELSPTSGGWTFSVIASLSGYHGSVGNLAFDSAGNLYGTTLNDGAYQYGNVFKLAPSGGQWTYSDLYDFTGGNDGGEPFAGPTLDSSGNIYGTALYGPPQICSFHGDPGCGVVWEIRP